MKTRRHYLIKAGKWLLGIWAVVQLGRVDWAEEIKTSGLDNFYYQQRINQYPPTLARFGYYTEKYLEPIALVKVRSKLFDLVDLRKLAAP